MIEKTETGLWPSLYDPFRTWAARMGEGMSPATDASLADGSYHIAIELPGVSESDLDIAVADGMVTVTGEKKSEREEKGDTWYFTERQFGKFRRAFRLPADADGTKVEAHLKDGVLTVTAPQLAPTKKTSRKVEVQAA